MFTGKFQDDELLYAFKKFDLNGTGYISVKELKQVLSNIGQNFSDSQIASMIASVDKDKDGQLNFEGLFLSAIFLIRFYKKFNP